jgi:hypothetical protein
MGRKKTGLKRFPTVGEAFAVPLPDGRFGACRVLQLRDVTTKWPKFLVAAATWVGDEPPNLDETQLRPILVVDYFVHYYGEDPRRSYLWADGLPPETFVSIGIIEHTANDQPPHDISHGGGWEALSYEILNQWNWEHDREAFDRDMKAAEEEEEQWHQDAARKRKKKMAEITFDKLKKTTFLRSWNPEFYPPDAIQEFRGNFRQTVHKLIALGPKAKTRSILRILQRCIERFNELDEKYHGELIETVEREQICEHFDELVHASGLTGKRYENLADRWRDW